MAQSVARRSHNNTMIGSYPEVMGSIPIGRNKFCSSLGGLNRCNVVFSQCNIVNAYA
jgi:hypothetical protein